MSNTPYIMENLIGAINKIQDIFSTLKVSNSIQLPQIVMLGSESTGKSSVLESIVHRPFLPRGSGIVTRCPLILQLVKYTGKDSNYPKGSNGTNELKEWGEFLHLTDRKFYDFDEIRIEIERRTDELAGANKAITHEPINLKIYSPNVVTLTLVDLPGITKVPVGDQPQDIEEQIKKLVMKYIENPNSIILSVSAANVNIANSESLKYARKVDPKGLRTLAVLTKVDLMDSDESAWKTLNGEVIEVKLGIVGTVNRSQTDINDNKTIDAQLKDEKEFFEKNYNKISSKMGIPFLSKRLSQLLMNHIKECLPGLKMEVDETLSEFKEMLEACGEEIKDAGLIIPTIIIDIAKKFCEVVDGETYTKLMDIEDLMGGPKFRQIFDNSFVKDLNEIHPEYSISEIIQYILNYGGPRSMVFPPEKLFQKLVNEQIERLRVPSIECLENCQNEMERVIQGVLREQLKLARFPNLDKKIRAIFKGVVNERFPIAKDAINLLINTELTSVNTNHPEFSIKKALSTANESNPNLTELKIEEEAKIFKNLILNYFPIVKKTIQDQVPKIIIHRIIRHMEDNISLVLLHQLDKEKNEKDTNLLAESEEIMQKREDIKEMIKALLAAKETINEIKTKF